MKNLLTAFAAAVAAVVAPSASACDPKTDPSCKREVPTVADPLACDPKTDPGCNREVPTVADPLACDPKTDPSCEK